MKRYPQTILAFNKKNKNVDTVTHHTKQLEHTHYIVKSMDVNVKIKVLPVANLENAKTKNFIARQLNGTNYS